MSARDELARAIAVADKEIESYGAVTTGTRREYQEPLYGPTSDMPEQVARRVLEAVRPRTITTAEELDALAVGAVVRTAGDEDKFDPRVAVKTATLGPHSYWAVAGDEDGFESMSDELDDLPATVLYEPAP